MSKVKYSVPGISCGHCKKSIENVLYEIGVKRAEVSVEDKTVDIELGSVTEDEMKEALDEIGFDVE